MKRFSSKPTLRIPKIIREYLGDDIYNQISKIVSENQEEREYVIYSSDKVIDAINEEINKELKTKYNLL